MSGTETTGTINIYKIKKTKKATKTITFIVTAAPPTSDSESAGCCEAACSIYNSPKSTGVSGSRLPTIYI